MDSASRSLGGLVPCPNERVRLRQIDYWERGFRSPIVKDLPGRRGELFSFFEYWAGKRTFDIMTNGVGRDTPWL